MGLAPAVDMTAHSHRAKRTGGAMWRFASPAGGLLLRAAERANGARVVPGPKKFDGGAMTRPAALKQTPGGRTAFDSRCELATAAGEIGACCVISFGAELMELFRGFRPLGQESRPAPSPAYRRAGLDACNGVNFAG